MHLASEPSRLAAARLPEWFLPAGWPRAGGAPVLADLEIAQGRIASAVPSGAAPAFGADAHTWNLNGAPVLPGLVDAHTHLDSAFTRERIPRLQPGLMGGIAGKAADRANWTVADVTARASRALQWAWAAGTVRLRTHVDWQETAAPPASWEALGELARAWAGRVTLERVTLVRPSLHATAAGARALARQVAASGAGARLGSFVHTSNFDPAAIRHLLEAAADAQLDVDFHVDEELDAKAEGLAFIARLLREKRFEGRVVCGHACALSAQPEDRALATLDAVARAPITLVSLPQNNLYLQDAAPGRTPRARGITLLKEARARAIPLLVASDSVQDPFFAGGSFDPVEALSAGVLAGQLHDAFDVWSDTVCRADRLDRGPSTAPAHGQLAPGAPADFVIFTHTDAAGWPSRAQPRIVLREGRRIAPPEPVFQLP